MQQPPGSQPPSGYPPPPGAQPPSGYPPPPGAQPPSGYPPPPGSQPPSGYPQPAQATPGPPPSRPGGVTAAAVLLIILGVIPCIFAVLAFVGASVLSGADNNLNDSGFAGLGDAIARVAVAFGVLALAYGVVKLMAGIKVLGRSNAWRVTGIVFASIGAAFWVLGLIGSLNQNDNGVGSSGPNAGGIVVSLALLVANVVVIVLLGRAGAWFRGGYAQPAPPGQFSA